MKKQRANTGHQWKKGESGNPNGRPPKGYSITEMMQQMMGADPERKAKIGNQILEKAEEGDINAIKLLWQYMDGMPFQSVEHRGEGGEPLSITAYIKQLNAKDRKKKLG